MALDDWTKLYVNEVEYLRRKLNEFTEARDRAISEKTKWENITGKRRGGWGTRYERIKQCEHDIKRLNEHIAKVVREIMEASQ